MRIKAALVVLLVCGLAFAANAQKDGGNDFGDQQFIPGDCPIDNYKGYTQEGLWEFDCDQVDLTMPIVDDGTTMQDVILDLSIAQTWVGDLVVKLSYDADCDGVADIGPVAALCRPQLTGCTDDQGDCCGCSGDIDGIYRFSLLGVMPLGEAECPTFINPGCYAPAPETEYNFNVFAGARKGGCFMLHVLDGACLDGTVLTGWSVWIYNGDVIATEQTTWGQIKVANQ